MQSASMLSSEPKEQDPENGIKRADRSGLENFYQKLSLTLLY